MDLFTRNSNSCSKLRYRKKICCHLSVYIVVNNLNITITCQLRSAFEEGYAGGDADFSQTIVGTRNDTGLTPSLIWGTKFGRPSEISLLGLQNKPTVAAELTG